MKTFTDWHTEDPEIFHFIRYSFDVQKAKRILLAKKRPAKVDTCPVAPLAKMVQIPRMNPDGTESFTMGISAPLPEDLSIIDLSIPLIWVQLDLMTIPIDGWTRIHKAHIEGIDELFCVVLSKADSRKVLID